MSKDGLDRVEHIVVLMLENRSFDHMLGYLSLDGFPVEGLKAGMKNSHDGTDYPLFTLPGTSMKPFETPEHGGPHVDVQLRDGGLGFAKDYIESRANDKDKAYAAQPEHCIALGYHDGEQLSAYDHLARQYCVCDHWFSSVPGSTMPNRLYSVVGTSGGIRENKKLFNKIDFPLYHYPSFVRHLDDAGVSWHWYHPYRAIPATLRMFDPHYLVGHDARISLFDHAEGSHEPGFLADAKAGKLASVSWIDPGFFDKFWMHENDDHPPTDVSHGQRLAKVVCDAMMDSPCWEKTLLVVTYDEHGGFFDHVAPPPAKDDYPDCRSYGVRVPAFIVSPFVEAGKPSSTVFDHTSIIRTILDRFCPGLAKDAMGTRVEHASNLAELLVTDAQEPRPIPSTTALLAAMPEGKLFAAPDPTLDELIESSTSGADLVEKATAHVESGAAAPAPGLTGAATEAEPRPFDELQLGLLAAAGEINRAKRTTKGQPAAGRR